MAYKEKKLVDKSTLGLVFKNDGDFSQALIAGKSLISTGDETYDLFVGKAKTIHSRYGELAVPLTRMRGQKFLINFVVRAFK